MPRCRSSGFTLVELLVVIAIIGVLSSVVLASLNTARENGRLTAGKEFAAHTARALGDQLEAQWEFDEGSGTSALDSSGNSKTGTITGATYTTGVSGTALSFNGTTNRVAGTGSVTVAQNMTITAWIWKDSSTSQRSFFSNRGAGPGRAYFGVVNSRLFYYDDNGTPPYNSTANGSIQFGRWEHVAVTSDGSTLRMYVNGVQIYSIAQPRTGSTGVFGIGWDPNIGTEYWDGKIDSVRVYSRTMLSEEIREQYLAERERHLARE